MLLHEGQDLLVRARIEMGRTDAALVVTFTTFGWTGKLGFGETFFERMGVPAIHVMSRWDHWWQTPELPKAFELIGPLREKYSRIVTYGASMGGHGALLASGPLRADAVLALAPQFAINGRNAKWHPTWSRSTQDLPELLRMEDALSQTAAVVIGVDLLNPFDMAHVRAINALRPVSKVPVSFCGHDVSYALSEMNLLTPIITDVLENRLDVSATTMDIRRARDQNLRIVMLAVARARKQGHRRLVLPVFQKLRELTRRGLESGDVARPVLLANALEVIHGHSADEDAQRDAQAFMAAYPTYDEAYSFALRVFEDAGRRADAILAGRRGLALNKKNGRLRLQLAPVVALDGGVDEAERMIRNCLTNNNPQNFRLWELARRKLVGTALTQDIMAEVTARAQP